MTGTVTGGSCVKRLVLSMVVVLLTVLAPPANAAMPPMLPSIAMPCVNDDEPIGKGWAKIWVLPEQVAITNPCTWWVKIEWGWDPANPNHQHVLFLAPGKKFNWDKAHALGGLKFPLDRLDASLMRSYLVCRYPFFTYGYAKRVYAYDDARSVPKCVNKNGGWVKP